MQSSPVCWVLGLDGDKSGEDVVTRADRDILYSKLKNPRLLTVWKNGTKVII